MKTDKGSGDNKTETPVWFGQTKQNWVNKGELEWVPREKGEKDDQ